LGKESAYNSPYLRSEVRGAIRKLF
jgi:hypothetical protein